MSQFYLSLRPRLYSFCIKPLHLLGIKFEHQFLCQSYSLHLDNDWFSAAEHEQAKTSGETRGTGWDVFDAGQYTFFVTQYTVCL